MIPKPLPRAAQPCPRCKRAFKAPNALYRHALKCRGGLKNRLHSTARREASSGFLFDSGLERKLYDVLKLRELAGEIEDLRVKPNVRITEAGILVIPDFSAVVVATGLLRFFEAKGFRSEVWLLKMRLWRAYGPAPIDVYVAGSRGPVLSETVTAPKPAETAR